MATLSRHGRSLGRIELIGKRKEYYANGDILINRGLGWKVYGKVKAGITPEAAFATAQDNVARHLATCPLFAKWRALFMELVAFKHHWKVLECIKLLQGDPDGMYSTLEDDFGYDKPELSLDDCCQLMQAYGDALAEAKAMANCPMNCPSAAENTVSSFPP